MSALLDTSVIVASLDPDAAQHTACDRLVAAGGHLAYVHALAETFSILTGGRHGRRLRGAVALQLIEQSVLPYLQLQALSGKDMVAALSDGERRGVRGGAVYDGLHLAAARKAGAERVVTLNLRAHALLLPLRHRLGQRQHIGVDGQRRSHDRLLGIEHRASRAIDPSRCQ